MLIHINKSWDFITAEAKHSFIKTWTSINFMSVLIILIKVEGKSDNTCTQAEKEYWGHFSVPKSEAFNVINPQQKL